MRTACHLAASLKMLWIDIPQFLSEDVKVTNISQIISFDQPSFSSWQWWRQNESLGSQVRGAKRLWKGAKKGQKKLPKKPGMIMWVHWTSGGVLNRIKNKVVVHQWHWLWGWPGCFLVIDNNNNYSIIIIPDLYSAFTMWLCSNLNVLNKQVQSYFWPMRDLDHPLQWLTDIL